MGVFTFEHETTSAISPAKLFQALILDADNLIPKVVPQAIASSEILQGDGGAGTIKKITFGPGSPYKNVTHKVEAVDKESFVYSYSVIEGDALADKYEKITYETKLEASDNGGCVIKGSSKYVTKGDDSIQVDEADVKANRDKASGLLKAVEAYLLANPGLYN
ncbi:major strawberry allergen Fra a 1.06-like [Prosopis cineraria]|uniref:major strawberry allergen Fra a 1.06-like n=1 Tax=Prosopis cineraria TaxID=364024 RepID=UPI00240F05C7|nr:major strawberry allergen Fra a 1.06-like [Prosopis cineraria]